MKLSDYLGFGLTLGFGLWWLVFPKSVIKFYTWFHRGEAKMPGTFGIRIAGMLWIVLVSVVEAVVFSGK